MTTILTLVALVYLGAVAFLYVTQRSLLYYPVPAAAAAPADELRWQVGDETLQIWRVNADSEDAVLYFGGNAEDVSLNIPQFARVMAGKATYLVNYRGYGGSTGQSTESALFGDAEEVYRRIAERHGEVTVVGRSLGSAVAMHLAAEQRPDRVVLITPFASIVGVAQAAFPLFPVSLLLKDRFDSEAYAARVAAPVLMLIAEQDEVIPRWSSDRLAAALDGDRLITEIVAGTGHNTIQLSPGFELALSEFIQGGG